MLAGYENPPGSKRPEKKISKCFPKFQTLQMPSDTGSCEKRLGIFLGDGVVEIWKTPKRKVCPRAAAVSNGRMH
jgi:hypothetical protein